MYGKHICKPPDYCICSLQALEPDEKCPIHGCGDFPEHCMICGRFLKWKHDGIEDNFNALY